MEEHLDFVNVEDLAPKLRKINIAVKAVEREETRQVESKRDGSQHTVCEILVGDETGSVILTLWDERVEEVEIGGTYEIKNGFISLFKGNIRLNVGKFGEIKKLEDKDTSVNKENNVSTKHFRDERRRDRFGFDQNMGSVFYDR